MSDLPFYKTVTGRFFFERQIPDALAELRKLRLATERIAAALEAQAGLSRDGEEEGQ